MPSAASPGTARARAPGRGAPERACAQGRPSGELAERLLAGVWWWVAVAVPAAFAGSSDRAGRFARHSRASSPSPAGGAERVRRNAPARRSDAASSWPWAKRQPHGAPRGRPARRSHLADSPPRGGPRWRCAALFAPWPRAAEAVSRVEWVIARRREAPTRAGRRCAGRAARRPERPTAPGRARRGRAHRTPPPWRGCAPAPSATTRLSAPAAGDRRPRATPPRPWPRGVTGCPPTSNATPRRRPGGRHATRFRP